MQGAAMNTIHFRILLLFLCITVFPLHSLAQADKHMIRVAVDISADDVVKSDFTSGINSGLRRLGGVVVTSDDETLRVYVVAMQNSLADGQRVGYIASIVVVKRPFSAASRKALIKDQLLYELFGDGVTVVHHALLGGPTDIQDLCKRIVANVDAGPIEDERKEWQEIKDYGERARAN